MLKRRVTRGKAERPSQRANELEQQKLFCVSENVVCPLLSLLSPLQTQTPLEEAESCAAPGIGLVSATED